MHYADVENRGPEWKREEVVVRGVALETGEIWRVTIGQGADGESRTTSVAARRFDWLKHMTILITKKSAGEKESKPAFKIFFNRNSDLGARQTSYI